MTGEQTMNHLVIATHSTLSEGFFKSVKLIVGDVKNVSYITAYEDKTIDYDELIKKTVSDFDYTQGNLIVATDLWGGSVNNEFTKYLEEYPFHLIAGVNLITVMMLILQLETLDAMTIKNIIQECSNSLIYCNDVIKNDSEDNDF